MKNLILIKSYYRNIKSKNTELFRMGIYGLITKIILSKEIFKKNSDINKLLNILDLKYKKYVMRSRTNIISRVIRDIERMNKKELLLFYKNIGRFLFEDIYKGRKPNKSTSKTNNKLDELLSQFKRGSNNES